MTQNAAHNGAASVAVGDLDNCQTATAAGSRSTQISDPIKVAEFWKNRRGDTVRVTLESYEGRNLVTVRQFYTTTDNKLAPTKKGVSIAIARLPDLAAAVTKALEKALELGLIAKVPK